LKPQEFFLEEINGPVCQRNADLSHNGTIFNGLSFFEWLERDTDPSPASSALVKKGKSHTSTPPIGHMACTKPHCLYKGALYIYIFTFPSLPRTISKWVSREQDEYWNYNDLSLTKFHFHI